MVYSIEQSQLISKLSVILGFCKFESTWDPVEQIDDVLHEGPHSDAQNKFAWKAKIVIANI